MNLSGAVYPGWLAPLHLLVMPMGVVCVKWKGFAQRVCETHVATPAELAIIRTDGPPNTYDGTHTIVCKLP